MEFIKKFAKEISVFGIVLIVFLGLFAYRQATFKDYKTISQKQLTAMVEKQDDFVIVIGDSTNTTVASYQSIMTKYTTKNRSTPLYYLDTNGIEDINQYIEDTFQTNVTYPSTLIIKNGKVIAKKDGIMQYYSLYDFIKENDIS